MTVELMKWLEGIRNVAYLDSLGNTTVGIGFNMDRKGARDTWKRLHIPEDFDDVYNMKIHLSNDSSLILYRDIWATCQASAKRRAEVLDLDYNAFPPYKQFILADIVYNVGNINNWTKVFKYKEPEKVLLEARRTPHKLLDSRIRKIGEHFGIIKDAEEARKLGIEYA